MPHDAPKVLTALAELYRGSAAGSHGGARDFLCDCEQLLRHADCHDGDEREKAEDDLLRAELESGKRLSIDRAAKSGIRLGVRLAKADGEAWLFRRLGLESPSALRGGLAAFFQKMAECPVPDDWSDDWRKCCAAFESRSASKGSVQPFRRDDPAGNEELLRALLGVIHWRDESLIRFASAVICGDSKRLEALEGRLVLALQMIRGEAAPTLEDLGILKKPRTLLFHGPLVLKFGNETLDFTPLPGPCSVSETNLIRADQVITSASRCLTVENEEVFLELAKRNRGWLLVHTSFPGSALRRLFARLGSDLDCWHFGDSDPSGFDILRDLREKTGRAFRPLAMRFRPLDTAARLTLDERKIIQRLLVSPLLTDVHAELAAMRDADSKGAFEQELVSLGELIEHFDALDSA